MVGYLDPRGDVFLKQGFVPQKPEVVLTVEINFWTQRTCHKTKGILVSDQETSSLSGLQQFLFYVPKNTKLNTKWFLL